MLNTVVAERAIFCIMPGHNHYSYCTCAWCLKRDGRRRTKTLFSSRLIAPSFTTLASFIIPNATCPVCGASVYFYQSPFGGRVFFDDLGPPWPKHPCTDNTDLSVGQLLNAPPRAPPSWKREGWEPIRIKSSHLEGNWHLIPVENLSTRLHFDALTEAPLKLQGETCAFMKPWDSNGWSKISYIELDRGAQEIVIPIFEKKRYFQSSRIDATTNRKSMDGA